jgi:uncharacterized protein (UPF0333 family)
MKNQRGAISASIILIIALVAIGAVLVFSYISAANYGNRAEVSIKAKYQDNENVYANGTQKVMEIAQVPAMMRDDIKEVFTAALQGRYGENGSQAVFQWIQEQNPQIDSSVYTRIQQAMEAFRNEFRTAQTALLDQCRTYETNLGYVWGGFWLKLAGYPKTDLQKMCTIVTTDKARQTFETKRDTGIQLRPAN